MLTEYNDGYYAVVWPSSKRKSAAKTLAPRLESLDGKTIAELWDYVYRGNEIYGWLEEGLKERFPGIRFINWSEFGCTHGKDEHAFLSKLPQRLKELGADAVISAIGA